MSEGNFFVSSYMRFSPVYVQENDTLLRVIESMKKFEVDTISVVKDDFSILGSITKKKIRDALKLHFRNNISLLKNIRVKDIIEKNSYPVVLYPNMEIEEAFSLMNCLNNTCVPVADSPWEKKMVGVLWLDDALSIIKESYAKLPA